MSESVRAVALAICKSRTCEGGSCCQWPANFGRVNCNAKAGAYDEAAEAAIAAMPVSEPGVWQPISTAPKDGTPILGYWCNGEKHTGSTDGADWFPAWEHDGESWVLPTHWMPLPPAPEAQP